MNRLLIVGGISGAGKSYMLEQLANRGLDVVPIKKLTTRNARPYEESDDIDLEYGVSNTEISKCEYRYNYAGETYGVSKKEIDSVLNSGRSPIVIVRSSLSIQQLKEDYPEAICIYIKSAYTGKDLKKQLREQGRTDIDIEERMSRQITDLHDYTSHFHLYDYVFSNLFDSDSLINQFDLALDMERKKRPLERGLAFVLMSFSEEMNPIFEEMIDAAKLVSRNIRIHRIDKQKGNFSITPEILSLIDRAELIICDLTEEKPNVYFELGYAKAKGKKIIHCAKKGTKLHFDIKDSRTIFYKNSTDFRRTLTEEFQDHFKGRN